MRDDFCMFILSHQRAGNVKTLKTLDRVGYTGPTYIVVDDKDPQLQEYRDRFGDQVLVFNKDAVEDRIDLGDNQSGQQAAIYARRKIWDFVDDLGVEYFMVLDDDYDEFRFRFDENLRYLGGRILIENLDAVLDAMIEYMKTAPIHSLTFSQGGDWIGGIGNSHAGIQMKRKAMNSFLCKADRPFRFRGRLNADVTTYTLLGNRGKLFFTWMPVQLDQESTQQQEGGLTEPYLRFGTYVKSFYTVMYAPSCTTVTPMGETRPRLHHRISWNKAVPKILPERYRKTRDD